MHPEPALAARSVVWIIDGEQWPRACLRAELIERGHDAVGFQTVRDALLALALPGRPRPELIIIELAGQSVTGRHLAALAQGGRPVAGIAGAVESEEEVVREFPWFALVRRPITLGAIADLAGRLRPPAVASKAKG